MAQFLHWFMPKEEQFYRLLKDLSSEVCAGATSFHQLIGSYEKLTVAQRKANLHHIHKIEEQCDTITRDIIEKLNTTFITPIDREDIHTLAVLLDDIIDGLDELAQRFLLFNITTVTPATHHLTELVVAIVTEVDRAVSTLTNMQHAHKICISIRTYETKGDVVYREALADLFKQEDPLEIIKMKDVYEYLEDAMDKCEDVANLIEEIMVKHS